MATLTPGQKVLGSLLAQPGFVEHMLSKTSPVDLVQGQSGPNVASTKDFLQRAGEKVGDFLQFVPGSEEDPKTLDGAPMPGGMDPNLFNAPADYQRRYRESMQGGDPTRR